jgi:hypothetical protein
MDSTEPKKPEPISEEEVSKITESLSEVSLNLGLPEKEAL